MQEKLLAGIANLCAHFLVSKVSWMALNRLVFSNRITNLWAVILEGSCSPQPLKVELYPMGSNFKNGDSGWTSGRILEIYSSSAVKLIAKGYGGFSLPGNLQAEA